MSALFLILGVDAVAVGLPVLQVREILENEGVTRVPGAAESIRGVINVRGSIVPVVDLAAALGLREASTGKARCVVLLETGVGEDRVLIGLATDSVDEVVTVAPADIEPVPAFGTRVAARYLTGLGKARGTFVLLLDVARILDSVLSNATATSAGAAGTTEGVAPQP